MLPPQKSNFEPLVGHTPIYLPLPVSLIFALFLLIIIKQNSKKVNLLSEKQINIYEISQL